MKITFHTVPQSEYVFSDVAENQFFINASGFLCQKRSSSSYNLIATADGRPFSGSAAAVDPGTDIRRVLPAVYRIEF